MIKLQSGRYNSPHDKAANSSPRVFSRLFGAAKIMFLIGLMAAVAVTSIDLKRRIKNIDAGIRHVDSEIFRTSRELENLRIAQARLDRWEHISAGIRRFNLRLRSAENGQVRHMRFYTPRQAAQVHSTSSRVARRAAPVR